MFSIDSATGAVTLTADPNYETKASYAFDVIVTDNGTGNLTDTQAVTLAINNVNEAPVLTAPISTSITSVGGTTTFSGTVSVNDVDVGDTFTAVITAFNGTLNPTGDNGAVISGDGTSFVELHGTMSDINTALNGMVFTADGAMDGGIFIAISDLAGATDSKYIEIQVASADAPQSVNLSSADLSLASYDVTTPVFVSGVSAAQTEVLVGDDTLISFGTHSLTLGGFNGDLDGTFVQFTDGSLLKTSSIASTLVGGSEDDQLIATGVNANTLRGYAGDDVLDGGEGNDYIYGGQGADSITGGAGRDLLYAGDTSLNDDAIDVFNYNHGVNEGNDFIIGFANGQDLIHVEGGNDYATAVTGVTYSGSNAIVALAGGTTITLMGVSSGINADDFTFSGVMP